MCLIRAVEPIAIDLWFTDKLTMGHDGTDLSGTHGLQLNQYGHESIQAYFDIADSAGSADYYGNILKPDYDSGYLTFEDLQPYKTHLYQLCPTIPNQPKFMLQTGDWHSINAVSPNAGGLPIGFKGDATGEHLKQIGTVSPKLYIKTPSGIPHGFLDEAPEGHSGPTAQTANADGKIEGMSGFIDGQMSPVEAPNWSRCLYLETGSSSLPQFRLVNDTDEFILDGRIRLIGWKYAIEEVSKAELDEWKRKSNGRLTFRILPTSGLPTASSLADTSPY
tara:strand:- start:24 stop:854 length:831 start_codon:yes stop_codon:yes gene_type:complete